jgi:hypothetical protein
MELLNSYSELAGRMPFRFRRKKTGTAHTSLYVKAQLAQNFTFLAKISNLNQVIKEN